MYTVLDTSCMDAVDSLLTLLYCPRNHHFNIARRTFEIIHLNPEMSETIIFYKICHYTKNIILY